MDCLSLLAHIVWRHAQFWAPHEVPPQNTSCVILPLSVGQLRLVGFQTAWRSPGSAIRDVCCEHCMHGTSRIRHYTHCMCNWYTLQRPSTDCQRPSTDCWAFALIAADQMFQSATSRVFLWRSPRCRWAPLNQQNKSGVTRHKEQQQ